MFSTYWLIDTAKCTFTHFDRPKFRPNNYYGVRHNKSASPWEYLVMRATVYLDLNPFILLSTLSLILYPDIIALNICNVSLSYLMMTSCHANIFLRDWSFVRGIHRWIPLTKDQSRGALMFSLLYAWINGWTNNGTNAVFETPWRSWDVTVTPCIDMGFQATQFRGGGY